VRIEDLTLEQLLAMNKMICQRIRELRERKTLQALIELQLGMDVVFDTTEGPVFGIVTKINRKTVSVMAEDGTHYRVSPSLLKPLSELE
jgi:preprotein translocase subunit YajC